MNCANCGVPIVLVKDKHSERWIHQPMPNHGSSYQIYELAYLFCKTRVAEPIIENIDTPLDKTMRTVNGMPLDKLILGKSNEEYKKEE